MRGEATEVGLEGEVGEREAENGKNEAIELNSRNGRRDDIRMAVEPTGPSLLCLLGLFLHPGSLQEVKPCIFEFGLGFVANFS